MVENNNFHTKVFVEKYKVVTLHIYPDNRRIKELLPEKRTYLFLSCPVILQQTQAVFKSNCGIACPVKPNPHIYGNTI